MDNCTYSMTYRLVIMIALLLPNAMWAQEGREGATFLLFGFGGSNQMDTYLSPMEYDGWQASVLTGRERMTRMAGGRISFQSMMQAAATRTENPARTAEMWGGRIAYDAAWHWNWTPAKGLRLKAGAQVGTDLGFLYNNRNGNNPAQGRVSADMAASVAAAYAFRIRRFPLALRYQADVPLLGCMFSPQYGQSYYELYIGNRDHNVCFAHPGNAFSIRSLLMMDLVFSRTTMRLGYLCDVRQSNVNGISTHDFSHSFMLGYVRYFKVLKRKDRKEDNGL